MFGSGSSSCVIELLVGSDLKEINISSSRCNSREKRYKPWR